MFIRAEQPNAGHGADSQGWEFTATIPADCVAWCQELNFLFLGFFACKRRRRTARPHCELRIQEAILRTAQNCSRGFLLKCWLPGSPPGGEARLSLLD